MANPNQFNPRKFKVGDTDGKPLATYNDENVITITSKRRRRRRKEIEMNAEQVQEKITKELPKTPIEEKEIRVKKVRNQRISQVSLNVDAILKKPSSPEAIKDEIFEGKVQKKYDNLNERLSLLLSRLDGERDLLIVIQLVKYFIESDPKLAKGNGIINGLVKPIKDENESLTQEIKFLKTRVKEAKIQLDTYYKASHLEAFPKEQVQQITVPPSDRTTALKSRHQQERDHSLSDWSRQNLYMNWSRIVDTRQYEVTAQLTPFEKETTSKDWITVSSLIKYPIEDLSLQKSDNEQIRLIESSFKKLKKNAEDIDSCFDLLRKVVAHKESLIVSYNVIKNLRHPETNAEQIIACFESYWEQFKELTKLAKLAGEKIDKSILDLNALIEEKLMFDKIDSHNLAILQKNKANADRIRKLEDLFSDTKVVAKVQVKLLQIIKQQIEKRLSSDSSSYLNSFFKGYINLESGIFDYYLGGSVFSYPQKENQASQEMIKEVLKKRKESV